MVSNGFVLNCVKKEERFSPEIGVDQLTIVYVGSRLFFSRNDLDLPACTHTTTFNPLSDDRLCKTHPNWPLQRISQRVIRSVCVRFNSLVGSFTRSSEC